jgi:hypothetical protein
MVFANKSHWTHGWKPGWRWSVGIILVTILSASSVPQLTEQWKPEYESRRKILSDQTTSVQNSMLPILRIVMSSEAMGGCWLLGGSVDHQLLIPIDLLVVFDLVNNSSHPISVYRIAMQAISGRGTTNLIELTSDIVYSGPTA